MKKVLIVATVLSHIAQFHKPLMKLLKDNGYIIDVAGRNNLEEKNGLQLEFADYVFDIDFNRSPFSSKNISAYKKLKSIINQNNYNIVTCNTPVGGVLTRLASKSARKNGSKIYYTAHGFHFYNGASKKNWAVYYPIEKTLAKHCDKLITITDEDYNLARKKFNTNIERLHGVGANSEKYFPLDTNTIDKIKSKLEIENKSPIILCVGELLPNKNHKVAIKAMSEVVKQYPKAKLLIAGNGRELDNLTQLTQELDIIKNVEFLGYTTKLDEYINICDVFVSCSYREGLPLNVIEAMLCKKAVIVSNNRGHRELVENDVTGYIFNPDDYKELANKINNIYIDSELNEKFTEKSLIKAQKYTSKSVIKELSEIYGV